MLKKFEDADVIVLNVLNHERIAGYMNDPVEFAEGLKESFYPAIDKFISDSAGRLALKSMIEAAGSAFKAASSMEGIDKTSVNNLMGIVEALIEGVSTLIDKTFKGGKKYDRTAEIVANCIQNSFRKC